MKRDTPPLRPLVNLEIDTYVDLVANERLWALLDEARELAERVGGWQRTLNPAATVALFPVGNSAPRLRKFADRSWAAAQDALARGELRSVEATFLMGRGHVEVATARIGLPGVDDGGCHGAFGGLVHNVDAPWSAHTDSETPVGELVGRSRHRRPTGLRHPGCGRTRVLRGEWPETCQVRDRPRRGPR